MIHQVQRKGDDTLGIDQSVIILVLLYPCGLCLSHAIVMLINLVGKMPSKML